MKVDFELLTAIMDSMGKDGPPVDYSVPLEQLLQCEGFTLHIQGWIAICEQLKSPYKEALISSFKYGMEVGLQYHSLGEGHTYG